MTLIYIDLNADSSNGIHYTLFPVIFPSFARARKIQTTFF